MSSTPRAHEPGQGDGEAAHSADVEREPREAHAGRGVEVGALDGAVPGLPRVLDEVGLDDELVDHAGLAKEAGDGVLAGQQHHPVHERGVEEAEDGVQAATGAAVARGVVDEEDAAGGAHRARSRRRCASTIAAGSRNIAVTMHESSPATAR